MQSVTETFDTN